MVEVEIDEDVTSGSEAGDTRGTTKQNFVMRVILVTWYLYSHAHKCSPLLQGAPDVSVQVEEHPHIFVVLVEVCFTVTQNYVREVSVANVRSSTCVVFLRTISGSYTCTHR